MFLSEFGSWILFGLLIIALLALDLGVLHRRASAISVRQSLLLSAFWIAIALAFNLGIYFTRGAESALEFLTAYLVEKSLAVDNLFVFVLIFSYFAIPARFQHKVLFWGIFGALLMRALFIAAGLSLLERFHWLIYVFGGLLLLTGLKLMLGKDGGFNPADSALVRLLRRLIPFSHTLHGERFFTRVDGKILATPLFLALLCVEFTDLIFAVDSIPAVLAVSSDPFIVYTSNVFAILGLRSLYFALAGLMPLFRYLKPALAAILVFIGTKMLLLDVYKLPIGISLGVVAGILGLAVAASLLHPPRKEALRLTHAEGRTTE